MSATLTATQQTAACRAAWTLREQQVPHRWLVVRLSVLRDGRSEPVAVGFAGAAARALADELDLLQGQVSSSVHTHDAAARVLRQMHQFLDLGPNATGFLLSLADPEALDAAAEHLAASPHGVLVVASAAVDGHALAARWS